MTTSNATSHELGGHHPTFAGAKIALICGQQLITYLRDNKTSIPFPNQWDLAGGGREGSESPEECVIRESKEEFDLDLPQDRICWKQRYDSVVPIGTDAYFMVAHITNLEVGAINFGDEGQHWRLMPIPEFVIHPAAVSYLQNLLAEYIKVR